MTPGDSDEALSPEAIELWLSDAQRAVALQDMGQVQMPAGVYNLLSHALPRLIAALRAATLRAEAAERVVVPITETAERLEVELGEAQGEIARLLVQGDLNLGRAFEAEEQLSTFNAGLVEVEAERDAARAVVAELEKALTKARAVMREAELYANADGMSAAGFAEADIESATALRRAAALRDGAGKP